jgi:hypothetical protein
MRRDTRSNDSHRIARLQRSANDAVLENGGVEVDQHALDLDDHLVLDDEIDNVDSNASALVERRNLLLAA